MAVEVDRPALGGGGAKAESLSQQCNPVHLQPAVAAPRRCRGASLFAPNCIYQNDDGSWSRVNTTDAKVLLESKFDYPPLARVLRRSGMRFVMDVGANEGSSSLIFARIFTDATVVALEPSLQNYAVARENTRLQRNVKMLRAAVWGKNTRMTMRMRNGDEWGAQVHERGTLSTELAKKRTQYVFEDLPAFTMPSLMKQVCFPHVDFLKLDIEGAERIVLGHDIDWLQSVRFMYMEAHEWSNIETVAISVRGLLRANMTVLTCPNLMLPTDCNCKHEYVYFACHQRIARGACMDACVTWRNGTGIKCAFVRSFDEPYGDPSTIQ